MNKALTKRKLKRQTLKHAVSQNLILSVLIPIATVLFVIGALFVALPIVLAVRTQTLPPGSQALSVGSMAGFVAMLVIFLAAMLELAVRLVGSNKKLQRAYLQAKVDAFNKCDKEKSGKVLAATLENNAMLKEQFLKIDDQWQKLRQDCNEAENFLKTI
ncbi:MAG: hypothetical protein V4478_03205 [Patescibacteria group bacterium]